MLQLDKNTLTDFLERGVKNIKVFFYESGCSGTKVDIEEDCEVNDGLVLLDPPLVPLIKGESDEGAGGLDIYVEKKYFEKLKDARITRTIKKDHTGEEKIRYIFSSDKVQDRCGCGSSFSFEKKRVKLNLENLIKVKQDFQ